MEGWHGGGHTGWEDMLGVLGEHRAGHVLTSRA